MLTVEAMPDSARCLLSLNPDRNARKNRKLAEGRETAGVFYFRRQGRLY